MTSNPEWPGTAGTSAATAHVAGAAALLRQARTAAGLPAGPADLGRLLIAGALDLGAAGPDPLYGAGIAGSTRPAGARAAGGAGGAAAGAGPGRGRRYHPPSAGDTQRPSPQDGEAAGGGRPSPGGRARQAHRDGRGHGRQRRDPFRGRSGARAMRRGALAPGLAAVAAVAAIAVAGPPGARAAAPAAITVDAKPGQVAQVAAGLDRTGLKVQRRVGRRLQVVAEPRRAAALARIPGVAGARPATAAFGDAVAPSQGIERSGADVLGRVADKAAGVSSP